MTNKLSIICGNKQTEQELGAMYVKHLALGYLATWAHLFFPCYTQGDVKDEQFPNYSVKHCVCMRVCACVLFHIEIISFGDVVHETRYTFGDSLGLHKDSEILQWRPLIAFNQHPPTLVGSFSSDLRNWCSGSTGLDNSELVL